MSAIKKLAGQTAVYGLSSIVGRLFNYLLTPILTNYFTTGQFGINTEFFSYISFLNVVFTYGMETAYFRYSKTKDEGEVYSSGTSTLFISSLVFSIILVAFSPLINRQLHYESYPYFIPMMAGILFFDTLCAIPFARLRFQNKPMRYVALKFVNIGVNGFGVLFFVVLAPWLKAHHYAFIDAIYNPEIGIGYVFISTLMASFITFIFVAPSLIKNLRWPDRALLREILPYALPLLLVGLAGMVNETLDRILLNYLVPVTADAKSQIGIYGACYKIAIIISLFIQAFRMAAEPFFFNQSNKENAKQVYADVMQLFVAACLLIVFGTLLFINYIQHFIGKDFRAGLVVVPILLLANLCLGVYYNLSIWYRLTDKTVYGSYISVIGAIITIALNILLIPTMGYVGSAWATLICYFSMMVISYFVGQKYFPVPYQLLKMGGQFMVVLAFYAVSALLVKTVFFSFGKIEAYSPVGFAVLSLLFVACTYVLFRLNKALLLIKLPGQANS